MPGVYIMKDKSGEVIYVGKAKRLRIRVSGYFRDCADHQPKVEKMLETAFDFDVIVTDSEFEALVLECSQIKQHMPKYNILLKDDKGFSYVEITNELYPRINFAFQPVGNARYIGPYMSSYGAKQLVELANSTFGLPTCQLKFPESAGKVRPCLNAHIGLCCAPCSGRVSWEEYRDRVDGAVELITKGVDGVLEKLKNQMHLASEAMEYEKAARYRDSIAALERNNSRQKVFAKEAHDKTDAFAFASNESCICAVVLKYRGGNLEDKDEQYIYDTVDIAAARDEFISHYYIGASDYPKRILADNEFDSLEPLQQMLTESAGHKVTIEVPRRSEAASIVNMAYTNAADSLKRRFARKTREQANNAELANLLGLSQPPKIIEAYDISNYGDDAVAGMVVFTDGRARRGDYRRFKIKTVDGTDDYAAMSEVISRRIARFDDWHTGGSFARKPDLILLDGGKGHLATVLETIKNTSFEDVQVFGMVKDDKHRTRALVGVGGELSVGMHKNAFHFVASIQEEVHRFSVAYRRESYSRTTTRSSLLKIPAVGEATAKALLKQFKTVEAISTATADELAAAPGVTRRAAENVYRYFNEKVTEE